MAEAVAGLLIKALGGAAALGGATVALINIGVGLVFSAVASALQRKRRPQTPGIRNKYTGRGDVSPQTICLGFYATGGHHLCPMYSHSRAPSTLGDTDFGAVGQGDYATFIINIADAPITAVTALYVDGIRFDLSTHMAGPLHPHYGQSVAPGVERDEWQGKVWIKVYDGTQTQADPYLVAAYGAHPDRPWKATSWHRGGSYVIITVLRDQTLFRSIPTFRFEIEGMAVLDPRTGESNFSTNAVALSRAVLAGISLPFGASYGMGVTPANLPADWWEAALDQADLSVENADGDFEAQYRAGIEIPIATPDDGGVDPLSALDDLLPAFSGTLADLGGTWVVRAGGPGLPVLNLTDDDILNSQEQSFEPFLGLAETHNAVAATFPNPAAKWETVEAPPRYNLAAEAEDGNRYVAKLDLDTVPYPDQVQRLMAAWGKDLLRRRVHVIALPPSFDLVTLADTVTLTSERHGYVDKVFEVQRYSADLKTGVINLVLREVDPSDFTPDASEYIPQDVAQVVRTPSPPLSLTAFDAVQHAITDGSEERRPAIRLTFSTPSANISGVAWEVYRAGELVVAGSTQEITKGEVVLSEGILPATNYSARMKPIADAQLVAWTAYEAVTTLDIRPSLADLGDDVSQAIDDAAQSASDDKTAAEEAAAIALEAKTILVGLTGNSDFSLEYENWTTTAAGTGTIDGNVNFSVVTTGTEVGGKALEVMGYNALVTKGLIPIDRTRTYRVRIRVKNVSGAGVSLPRFLAGVATFDESLAQETDAPGPNRWCVDSSYNYVPDDGEWHTYEGEITGEGATHNNFRSTTKWARLFVGLNYGQSLSQKLQVDEFRLDDITEVKEAEAFAEEAELSATTASGHASAALTQAGYATDSAAAAAVAQKAAARSFSAAIIDPTFLNWVGAAPANVTFYEGTNGGTLAKSADDTFGNAIVFTTPASPPVASLHPFVQLQSSNPGLELLASTDTLRIQIRATIEKLSGSLVGGWIRATWYALGTGGTSALVDVPFSTELEDANGVQVMEALFERPETFVEGSSPGFVVLQVFATGFGGSSPAVSFKLHNLQAEAVNALASASIAQIAKTTLDGIAASTVALTTQAGDTYASLRVAAFDDLQNPYSKVEVEADYFVFRGGLAIFEDAALQSSDFVTGVSGWQISEDGNAEFNQLIVRESIVPGAVSDDTRLVDVTEQASGHSVAVLTGNTGPIAIDDFYHFAFRCEYRAPNTSGGSTTISFRYKTLTSGVWSAYSNFQFSVPRGVSTWALVNGVTHFSGGPYEDIQFELVTEIGGTPTTVSQTNIRNAMILANALQR